jgi:hypothetical protein
MLSAYTVDSVQDDHNLMLFLTIYFLLLFEGEIVNILNPPCKDIILLFQSEPLD